jgi:hypothetical protein
MTYHRFPIRVSLAVTGVAAAAIAWILVAAFRPARATTDSPRRPVLVELFTSEGCSSCPPADALLARLDAQQFVAGAQAIVLSEHVTYWNQDGWHDPFSLDDVTDRQQQYVTRFGLESSYTPQAVIDGASQVVGSDEAGLRRAIAQAAKAPALDLEIEDAAWTGSVVRFKARVGTGSPMPDANVRLVAALAVDSAQSSIKSGENAGRTVRHVAVVRAIQDMGKQEMGNGALDGRELSIKPVSPIQSSPVRLVVFVADRRSGRVLGVTERTITR